MFFYVHLAAFIIIVRQNIDSSVDMATGHHFFGHLLLRTKANDNISDPKHCL